MNNRRNFLKRSVATAGALGGISMFPDVIQRALAIEPNGRTKSLKDVEHVVMLTQENRSFDHYFGTLQGVRGFSDPRPHLLPTGQPVWYQPPASPKLDKYQSRGLPNDVPHVLPFYIDPRNTTGHAGTLHGWVDGHAVINEGRNDQWLTQKQDVMTMGYLKRQDVSFHYALADAFTICDAYFCSTPADTLPNRIFMWTGTMDPRNVLGTKPNGPAIQERYNTNGYTWTTYPERLEKAGISWKVYQGGSAGYMGLTAQTDNFTDNSLEFFEAYQKPLINNPLRNKGGYASASKNTLKQLHDDVQNNKLPQVSWIVAPNKFCEHSSATTFHGATYISAILTALISNPEVWSKTVFLINYDENDGLFDHVVPPAPVLDSALNRRGMVSRSLRDSLVDEFMDMDLHAKAYGNNNGLAPGGGYTGLLEVGLGSRVPMLVISPWSRGGWVCSETFDHTSLLRFLETRFGIAEPQISAWRRSVCGDLTSAFDFSTAGDPSFPRVTVDAALSKLGTSRTPAAIQSLPRQEPGTRKHRPLDYEFLHRGRCSLDEQRFWIDFSNTGKLGAGFHVIDALQLKQAPRRYTVAAGDSFADYWEVSGPYHYLIYGSNGYLTEFKGDIAQAPALHPDAFPCYDTVRGDVIITVVNRGLKPLTFSLSNAYAKDPIRQVALQPGETADIPFALQGSQSWYDIGIRVKELPAFAYRFAGHVETGRASMTDPGPHN
ncbi:phospholipase C, phosphocholine-specific [Diaphorobacter sp. HDW4B]|uniref:phosphocholine-specific phospholipase C n=1 Tax=Diaphorobacter sp. HDW4B TaxID=2714925 RepID=UPI001409A788|nr:phospholipase C, phosphocholine-specific [Diaphorobacter sp. HDW4B]QIL72593.1 phospholipase C, phosphocholine-specific [Diaphorobacter sp. HDW4B]